MITSADSPEAAAEAFPCRSHWCGTGSVGFVHRPDQEDIDGTHMTSFSVYGTTSSAEHMCVNRNPASRLRMIASMPASSSKSNPFTSAPLPEGRDVADLPVTV